MLSIDSLDAAHGGPSWLPRTTSMLEEIGRIWGEWGVTSEWEPLEAVLMHRPGSEIEGIRNPDEVLMLDRLDVRLARQQHDDLVKAYKDSGVAVHYMNPDATPPPNQMFVADLLFMTAEGAVLARPASSVRAGEERFTAARLSELGVPILKSVRGEGVFEGADACWVSPTAAVIGTGLRTNTCGAIQVENLLKEMNIKTFRVGLPYGAMHLMGTLRFVDRDMAICWRTRVPSAAVLTLREHGYEVAFLPDEAEAVAGLALNFVTLAPQKILMPEGNPVSRSFYEKLGIECVAVETSELHKAAGGIGCLTGILRRRPLS